MEIWTVRFIFQLARARAIDRKGVVGRAAEEKPGGVGNRARARGKQERCVAKAVWSKLVSQSVTRESAIKKGKKRRDAARHQYQQREVAVDSAPALGAQILMRRSFLFLCEFDTRLTFILN